MNRRKFVEELKKQSQLVWDIIVIGGGATGLGIALDGASRGYKTLLLEQADFAKATSSRSTKLVHGGVRYMAQGDLLLVMEALHERGLMLKNAPHLTFDQEFIIPVYTLWDAVLYTVGLKFYDLLSGRLSMGKSYFIGREKTLTRLPLLQLKRLRGGVVYHDGQFDDSRMAFALAESCVDKGGLVLNYFKVTGLLKDRSGKISGVKATDISTGDEFNLKANLVINATGVFADEVARMDNADSKPTLKPSQGVQEPRRHVASGPQCTVRAHQPAGDRLPHDATAGHLRGHQEEGIGGRLQERGPGMAAAGAAGGGATCTTSRTSVGQGDPYGVYDMARNEGWVSVGIDHDTAACRGQHPPWWREMGRRRYPRAERLVITADGGGSNGCRGSAVEGGAAAIRRRDRPGVVGLSLSAGHQQVEQDRASAVLPHHPELARAAR